MPDALSPQSADHRLELIRALRIAQSRGRHSIDATDRDRAYRAMCDVGDWNRAHPEAGHRISGSDVDAPLPGGLIVSFEM